MVLGAVELALRVFLGAPTGYFDFLLPAVSRGLYPPDAVLPMDWGRVPYVVHTNALGLRRVAVDGASSRAKGRIVTIGDSMTDGFYVDDDGTFQSFLQRRLDEELGPGYQVINAARGGASLPKELAILREIALPLDPAIVILVFTTNDISELRDGRHERLEAHHLRPDGERLPLWERAGLWLATRTALGETALRLYWERYVRGPVRRVPDLGEERYRIPGGRAFRHNARDFLAWHADSDGIVHVEPFAAETRAAVAAWLALLADFVATCREAGATPVLAYLPSYAQVYLPDASLRIRDVLEREAHRLDLAFVDLTPEFRREGAGRVLHLAPVDHHHNPAGNEVIARGLFEFLVERELVR